MKKLFLSVLVAAVSIVEHTHKVRAAVVQELCVNGQVSSTTTPAQGPDIAITSCQWASSTTITTDPSTATSLVVSGGKTLGTATINISTSLNPMAISITNGFTTSHRTLIIGELPAGSSVVILDCSFTVRLSDQIDFRSLILTGSDFVFSRNLATVTSNVVALLLPSCSRKCSCTIDDNVLNYTVANNQNGILTSITAHSVTFVSRRNRFLISRTGSVVGIGYRIAPNSLLTQMSPPANWSLVTDDEMRDAYGKSTYVIADNVFENITRPWSISDTDGADFTIENNTALNAIGSLNPSYTCTGNYYRFNSVIRNNTLTSGAALASIDLSLGSLPAHSLALIQNNTITTGGVAPRIVRLQGRVIYNATALLEISNNVLLSSSGSTGLMNNTVYSIYSTSSYSLIQEAQIAVSSPLLLFGNTLFGVPIDTHELTLSTVYFTNSSRTLKIDTPYPKPTAAPTTTTAAPTTSSTMFSYSEVRCSPSLGIGASAVTLGIYMFLLGC